MTDKRYGMQVLPGFKEPKQWPFDGCKRREPVLDIDRNPPVAVRHVGWRSCMKCQRPFFSADVIALRICDRCKGVGHVKPLKD